MPELQLKVISNADDGVIGKAISNFGRVIYSSGAGFYGFVISAKRNSLLKAFSNFENYTAIPDETKRAAVITKYEKAYENYLNTLEKFVEENIYAKVLKKVGTLKENRLMSKYYEISALKGTSFVEYKYKRQALLLDMDWDNILTSKNQGFVSKYKKFYVYVMEQVYKALMRHYAILLTDLNINDATKYSRIYDLVESYIKFVLPYCENSEDNRKIIDAYQKFVSTIDIYSQKTYSEIKKNMVLLRLSRVTFMYSLPMIAAEECFIGILKDCRAAIANSYIDADKYELYKLLLDTIEAYNDDILSKKVTWDNQALKADYKIFWDKYLENKKLERIDYDEYMKNREILFVTYDLKMLKKSKKNYDGIKNYYRERMIMLHGFRCLKNKVPIKSGIWRPLRRMICD